MFYATPKELQDFFLSSLNSLIAKRNCLLLSFWEKLNPVKTTNSFFWSKTFWPRVKVSLLWQGSNAKSQSWLSNWDSWRGKGLIHFLNCCSFCSELSGFCLNCHLLSYSWQTQYQHHPHLHLHHHRHCYDDDHNHNDHHLQPEFSKWQHSQLFMTKCMTVLLPILQKATKLIMTYLNWKILPVLWW